ncbi:thiamine biosynthesis regulatory protein [Monosporozyma servazzii]
MPIKQDKKERTFTGCWSCRLKKRRCDVGKPVCSLCAKNHISCSYEVRLVWSEENIYKSSDKNIIDLLQHDKRKNKVTTQRKYGLSKSEFKDIIYSKQKMNPHNFNYQADDKNNEQAFTISVRRFQVYDNEIKSVFGYGNKNARVYDQKVIDRKLNMLLNQLDRTVEDSLKPNSIETQQGPFKVFHSSFLNSTPFMANHNFDESFSTIESTIFSPGSDTSLNTAIDSQNDYHSDLNKIDFTLNHLEETHFGLTLPILDQNPFYLNYYTTTAATTTTTPTGLNVFPLAETEEDETFNILLSHCTDNMILSRQEYSTWFLNHMKQLGQTDQKSHKLIIEILTDLHLVGAENFVHKLISMGPSDKELQIVGLTIIVVLHGIYNDFDFLHQLEQWLLAQDNLRYSMYALINFIIINSESCEIFNHCHYLITTFLESEDPYQDELTFELDSMITNKLIGKWKDKISLQLTLNEDITDSAPQLQYWELQSKCNEQFYKDVKNITDLSSTAVRTL